MKQIFDSVAAKKKYVECYYELQELGDYYRDHFATLIRQKADEKVTSLEDLETFYLTVDDVCECHERVMQDHDKRDCKIVEV